MQLDTNLLARQIRNAVATPKFFRRKQIFLCGQRAGSKGSTRDKIAHGLNKSWFWKYRNELIYPEDLFEELVSGHGKIDMLTLENILALNVDAVVVVCESPGAFAELGAFANHEELVKKIVCVVNKKYERAKSFINLGPIAQVRKQGRSRVIYIDFNEIELNSDAIDAIVNSIGNVIRSNAKIEKPESVSLFDAPTFVLASLYVFNHLSRSALIETIEVGLSVDLDSAKAYTAASLSLLTKRSFIKYTSLGYSLTAPGANAIGGKNSRRSEYYYIDRKSLDDVRFRILSYKLRNRLIGVKSASPNLS